MKLKLTPKEITAVRRSIAHWKRDVEAGLLKGREIEELFWQDLRWKDTNERVRCHGDDCALCESVKGFNCEICPYVKKYGYACDEWGMGVGHWAKFVNHPNLRTCRAMIRALERILT